MLTHTLVAVSALNKTYLDDESQKFGLINVCSRITTQLSPTSLPPPLTLKHTHTHTHSRTPLEMPLHAHIIHDIDGDTFRAKPIPTLTLTLTILHYTLLTPHTHTHMHSCLSLSLCVSKICNFLFFSRHRVSFFAITAAKAVRAHCHHWTTSSPRPCPRCLLSHLAT